MADSIESAEAFTSRIVENGHDYDHAYPLVKARDAAIRKAALEDAAELCETTRRSVPESWWNACEECADRVRALLIAAPCEE